MPAKKTTTRKAAKKPRKQSIRYSAQLGVKIAELVLSGSTVPEIAKMRGMPSKVSIYNWMNKYEDFFYLIQNAYEVSQFARMDRAIEIAMENKNDWQECTNKNGDIYFKPNYDVISRSKLQCDVLMKTAEFLEKKRATMKHKEQGDRLQNMLDDIRSRVLSVQSNRETAMIEQASDSVRDFINGSILEPKG